MLTSEQVSEWIAYERIDPVGEWRSDARNSQLIATIYNLFLARFGKKGTKSKTPADFMPKWDSEQDQNEVNYQDVDEMKSQIQAAANIFGKGKKRRSKNKKRNKKDKDKSKEDK